MICEVSRKSALVHEKDKHKLECAPFRLKICPVIHSQGSLCNDSTRSTVLTITTKLIAHFAYEEVNAVARHTS